MNYPPLHNEIQADDWTYVGEGNQNLVVKYTGLSEAFSGKVLRLVKGNSKIKHVDEQALLLQKAFVDRVVGPLLGKEYITSMEPVSTSELFLSRLAANIRNSRPSKRLETEIIADAPVSFVMADLTQIWPGSPTLTFELKPKWGFKPSSDTVAKIKSMYCRYCMHSHMRQINLNGYCPLDLYSQNPPSLLKALDVLLKKAPVEKTLKVSINGEYTSLTSRDPDAEYKSLLDIRWREPLLTQILCAILLQDPILPKLKTLQADLDELDVENILPLYLQLDNVQADIDSLIKVMENYKRRKLDTNTPITNVQRVLEYVLSMTFKDCSIMINVVPVKEEAQDNKIVTLDNGLIFNYDIKVIDTDLKSLSKIPYWHELDRSIAVHAMKTGFSKDRAF
ncbi:inositol-pentakisphosphate 2-kinase [Parasitella parasitica]|nr:inositol-pentakisphosphate 2-kinase [Parasitella parasitica]